MVGEEEACLQSTRRIWGFSLLFFPPGDVSCLKFTFIFHQLDNEIDEGKEEERFCCQNLQFLFFLLLLGDNWQVRYDNTCIICTYMPLVGCVCIPYTVRSTVAHTDSVFGVKKNLKSIVRFLYLYQGTIDSEVSIAILH